MKDANTSTKATTLREIRRACGLGPLSGDSLGKFWVNTDDGRDPRSNLRLKIKMKLDDAETEAHAKSDMTRILVYGHSGAGKTTELSKLVEELGEGYFVVRFSVDEEMNRVAVNAEDILLVMAERLLSAAKDGGLNVKESQLKPIYEYFAKITRTTNNGRESEISFGAEASAGPPAMLSLFKLLANFKGDIKFNADDQTTTVAELRKRPMDLCVKVNQLIESVREALRPLNKRLLIIVEDLDKIDIARAQDVFIRNSNLLSGVATNIIYTIPIFTFHSPDAGAMRSKFNESIGLPMIKVMESDGKNRADGFDVVKKIVWQRIDPSAIREDALDLLVEKTGGVLRHVFEVIHTAATITNATTPLAKDHIEYGLQDKRKQFWAMVSLPPGGEAGIKNVNELYDRLKKYARKQAIGEEIPPQADPINQILLRSCALIEYNGRGWLGVHPLVIENLKELGPI